MSITKNNFDILRLLAAFQVAFSHASTHLEHSVTFLWFLSLFPGVPIFFFLSGYLIYGSFQSSSNNKNQINDFETTMNLLGKNNEAPNKRAANSLIKFYNKFKAVRLSQTQQ